MQLFAISTWEITSFLSTDLVAVCRVVLNMFFFSSEWAGASDELQVLPIAWKTEMTSQDYSEWYNFEFEYCNQVGPLSACCYNTAVSMPDADAEICIRMPCLADVDLIHA